MFWLICFCLEYIIFMLMCIFMNINPTHSAAKMNSVKKKKDIFKGAICKMQSATCQIMNNK